MRKIVLVFMLLAIGLTGMTAQNSLTLTLSDGTQRVFQLSERPELLWEGDQIIIMTATTEIKVNKADFVGFSVSDADAVKAVKNGGSSISIGPDGVLKGIGLKKGGVLSVYDATGRQLIRQTIAADGHVTVSLAALPAGTYFVKTDHQPTLKIMKP